MQPLTLIFLCIAVISASNLTREQVCVNELFSLIERLASFYCRPRFITGGMPEWYDLSMNPTQTITHVQWLSDCAYGKYDYLNQTLPAPLEIRPGEPERMMAACLAQQAALRFLGKAPEGPEALSVSECPAVAFDVRIQKPYEESVELLRNTDILGMLGRKNRHPCLEAVMSAFAREHLVRLALTQPPKKPSGFGQKLVTKEYDLNEMPEGLEWPLMFYTLKNWTFGELKGFTINYRHKDSEYPFPTITVYTLIKRGGLTRSKTVRPNLDA